MLQSLYMYMCLCRVLVQFMPEFAGHGAFVQFHTPSQYSKEMSQKSIVVCTPTYIVNI